MGRVITLLLAVLVASPAFAQSPYIVGSFGVDISRLGAVENPGFEPPSRDGEVIEGALRVGTTLGDRWGVELEFARGGDIESEASEPPRILSAGPLGTSFTFTSNTGPIGPTAPVIVNFRQRLEQQHQTLAALAWIRQPVGARVDLVYLGGVGFWRTAREQEIGFAFPIPFPTIVPPPRSQTTRITTYGAAPVAGFEAHLALTDHVRVIPGLRMQSIGDVEGTGWMVRAGVGLGWVF
jgi:hypothetical protein